MAVKKGTKASGAKSGRGGWRRAKPGREASSRPVTHQSAKNVGALIAEVTRNSRGISVDYAKEKLGVSQRTLYRYVKVASAVRLGSGSSPVRMVRGADGRQRIQAEPDLIPPASTAFKVLSLQLAVSSIGFLKGTAIQEGAEELWQRLGGGLDDLERPRLRQADKKLYALPFEAKDYAEHDDLLDTLLQALVYERQLEITYAAPARKPQTHQIEPLTLCLYKGGLYLIARKFSKEKPVIFAVERITGVSKPGEHFDYPRDYNPAAYFNGTFGIMPGGKARVEVEIRLLNPYTVAYVKPRSLHPTQKLVQHGDGTATLTMTVCKTDELRNWILAHGPWMEVVRPAELREEVRGLFGQAAALYSSRRASAAGASR